MENSRASINKDMPMLDRIHLLFLLYSGAHNVINAFVHAHNLIFFLFVVVGILSVELMLWAVYHHWKGGRLVGSMRTMSVIAGAFAFLYATIGILAKAQDGGGADWLAFYYAWILPTSAPCMFLFSFLIQSVDPITNADRDVKAYEHHIQVEEKREVLDSKQLSLDNRRNIRRLKAHVQHQRMDAVWKEAQSSVARRTLKYAARNEVPKLFKAIGISDIERRSWWDLRWGATYDIEDAKVLGETPSRQASGDGKSDSVIPDLSIGKPGK